MHRYVPLMTTPSILEPSSSVSPSTSAFPWSRPDFMTPPSSFPPYFRPSFTVFPRTRDLARQCGCSLAVILTPGVTRDLPLIDHSQTSFIRCATCSGYLCPYTELFASGRSFRCPFCLRTTDLEAVDAPLQSSPEVTVPAYEVVPPPNYTFRRGIRPAFCIIVDMSRPAVACGFTAHFAASVRTIVPTMRDDVEVCLIGIGSSMSWFNLRRASEVVACDIENVVHPDGVRAPLGECRAGLSKVLDSIAKLETGRGKGHCLPAGLLLAEELLADSGGIIVIGCINGPMVGPPTYRRPKNDQRCLKCPESATFWRELSRRFIRAGISSHLFAGVNGSVSADFGIIAYPSFITAGSVYDYGQFTGDSAAQLHIDLFRTLTAIYRWDCTARLRCSKGVRVSKFYGGFATKAGSVSFPVVSNDQTFTIELSIDHPIVTDKICVQFGMIYTTDTRERRVRVMSFEIPVTGDDAAVVPSIDIPACAAFVVRKAVWLLRHSAVDDTLNKDFVAFTAHGGMRFESYFRLIHAFVAGPINRPGPADRRLALFSWSSKCPLVELVLFLCPRMFALDSQSEALPCTADAFARGTVFLLHCWNKVYISISSQADAQFVRDAFGDKPGPELKEITTPENKGVWQVVRSCHELSGRYLPVVVVRHGDGGVSVLEQALTDRNDGGMSFAEWFANKIRVGAVT